MKLSIKTQTVLLYLLCFPQRHFDKSYREMMLTTFPTREFLHLFCNILLFFFLLLSDMRTLIIKYELRS